MAVTLSTNEIANRQSPTANSSRHCRQWKRLEMPAFTLVEIMVAIAVFMMVLAAVYSSWMALMRSTTVAESVAAQAQRQRITLRTIEDSLMASSRFRRRRSIIVSCWKTVRSRC